MLAIETEKLDKTERTLTRLKASQKLRSSGARLVTSACQNETQSPSLYSIKEPQTALLSVNRTYTPLKNAELKEEPNIEDQ